MAKKVIETPSPNFDENVGLVELGQEVRHIRTKAGLTIGKLSSMLSISRSTLVNIEKGNGKVSTANLFRVLREVGVFLLIEKND